MSVCCSCGDCGLTSSTSSSSAAFDTLGGATPVASGFASGMKFAGGPGCLLYDAAT